jgi:hypothetical protein
MNNPKHDEVKNYLENKIYTYEVDILTILAILSEISHDISEGTKARIAEESIPNIQRGIPNLQSSFYNNVTHVKFWSSSGRMITEVKEQLESIVKEHNTGS